MKRLAMIAALPLALAMPVAAQEERPVTPASILAASTPVDRVDVCNVQVLIRRIDFKGNG